MKIVLQRVSKASVSIEGKIKSAIDYGFMALLGIRQDDSIKDLEYIVKKTCQLRVFEDEDGKMNLSLKDIKGEFLLISQFTLYANTKKGNRPSFIQAARPSDAIPLYEKAIILFEQHLNKKIETGTFGADMKINLINDGPVTIIIDSRNK